MKVDESRHAPPFFLAFLLGTMLVVPCGATERIAIDPKEPG